MNRTGEGEERSRGNKNAGSGQRKARWHFLVSDAYVCVGPLGLDQGWRFSDGEGDEKRGGEATARETEKCGWQKREEEKKSRRRTESVLEREEEERERGSESERERGQERGGAGNERSERGLVARRTEGKTRVRKREKERQKDSLP